MMYTCQLDDFMCFYDKLPTFLKSYLHDLGLSYYLQALEEKLRTLIGDI